MQSNQTVAVLFVCMGNICRSPTAEGIFRKLVQERQLDDQIIIDSAGTHSYNTGLAPDERATATAKMRGIDLTGQRARTIEAEDFEKFDYLIAMDRENEANMRSFANDADADRIHLLLSFATNAQLEEVPDPYFGGDRGFEPVFNMIEDASRGLLEAIQKSGRLAASTT